MSAGGASGGNPFASVDYILIGYFLALMSLGGLFIYSVDIQQVGPSASFFDFLLSSQAGKQLIWIVISLLVFVFILFVLDHTVWQVFAYPIYGIGLLGLVLVLFLGSNINGATAWFAFGGFSFQPTEIAKVGTCLGLAAYLSHWSVSMRNTSQVLRAIALFLAPVALIILQPDAGSALVFLVAFMLVLFREGLNPLLYVIGLMAVATFIISILLPPLGVVSGLALTGSLIYLLYEKHHKERWLGGWLLWIVACWWAYGQGYAVPVLIANVVGLLILSYRQYAQLRAKLIPVVLAGFFLTTAFSLGSSYLYNDVLKPHQRNRIDVWLRPEVAKERDKYSVFNLEMSKLAISAGGLAGQGLFEGRMTQGRWVPAQNTDFIFCTIGEEQGFLGSAAVVILYLLLLLRIINIAERQRLAFSRIYAYGVAGIIFVHVLVNIGMTVGLMPIIGIPLPLISKGGSSLLGFTIMIAILLKLDRHRGRLKQSFF